jgi:hypothetical protein
MNVFDKKIMISIFNTFHFRHKKKKRKINIKQAELERNAKDWSSSK